MKVRKQYPQAALLLVGSLGAGHAFADDVQCPPGIGSATVDGNVLVAAACRLEGTYVKGNIHVYAGGSLIARNIRIEGSVQTERAAYVDIRDSQINGSIQLDDMVGAISQVIGTRVGGSIQMKGNVSRLEVLGNDVRADIQAFTNSGGVVIEQNTVDGNLQCKSNAPAPVGGGNRVSGNREDQCADLRPEGTVPAVSGVATAASTGTAAATTSSAGGGGRLDLLTLLLGAFAMMRRRQRA